MYLGLVRAVYREMDRVEYQVENQAMVREVYLEMDRGLEEHLGLVDRADREDLMDPEGRVVQRVRVDRDLEAHLDLEVQQGREVRVEHWD